MFAEKYRRAYDEVTPSQQIVSAVLRQAEGAQGAPSRRNRRKIRTMTAAAAVFLAVCAGGFAVLPVCAAQIPAFYRVIEFVSPGLADRLVPVEKSSSSQGITMEVEAVDLQGMRRRSSCPCGMRRAARLTGFMDRWICLTVIICPA